MVESNEILQSLFDIGSRVGPATSLRRSPVAAPERGGNAPCQPWAWSGSGSEDGPPMCPFRRWRSRFSAIIITHGPGRGEMDGVWERMRAEVVRRWARARRWRRRVNRRAAEEPMREVQDACTQLGLDVSDLRATAEAVRASRLTTETLPYGWMLLALAIIAMLLFRAEALARTFGDLFATYGPDLLARAAYSTAHRIAMSKAGTPLSLRDAYTFQIYVVVAIVGPWHWLVRRRLPNYRHTLTLRTNSALCRVRRDKSRATDHQGVLAA
nr:hypothetical protein KitaXyl93_76850 [Kitasatospora sp. Xyl93]